MASAAAASSASAAAASSPATAASANAPPAPYRWPWVTRDANSDLPTDVRFNPIMPGLPRKDGLPPFNLNIEPSDRSFHEWNTFRNSRKKTEAHRTSLSEKKRRESAEAYHELGVALMAREERGEARWAEARAAFAHDYVISRTLANPHEDVLPALRQMSVCAENCSDWRGAVVLAEQAITDAVLCHPPHPEERQAAFVHLGLVCSHWLEHLNGDERFDHFGALEREQLTEKIVACFRRSLQLAEALRPSTSSLRPLRASQIHEIKRNAHINMANAVQMRMDLLLLKQLHQRRHTELLSECSGDSERFDAPFATPDALKRTDFACLAPSRTFEVRGRQVPSSELSSLYKEARPFLLAAQRLCFAADAPEDAAARPALPTGTYEIDEQDRMPEGVAVLELSKLLHTHGMVLEASGQAHLALDQYVASARRLNCLKPLARVTRCLFDQIIDGQTLSLTNALLVHLRLAQYDKAERMARQLIILAERALAREEEDETGRADALQEELDRALQRLQSVRTKKALQEQLKGNEASLREVAARAENSSAHYALLHARRALHVASAKAGEGVEDTVTEGATTQAMLNVEREMWTMLRVQRRDIDRAAQPDHWKESLQREAHLLISAAQSVSAMAALLFPASPAKGLERRLCDKYWRMARLFFMTHCAGSTASVPLLGSPAAHWDAFTLAEWATSLGELRGEARQVLRLREEAFAALDSCVQSKDPVELHEGFLQARLELAEEIAPAYEALLKWESKGSSAISSLAEAKTRWANQASQLRAAWAKIERDAKRGDKEAQRVLTLNESMQDNYEGNEETASNIAIGSAAVEPAALVSPPSSKPLPRSSNASTSAISSASGKPELSAQSMSSAMDIDTDAVSPSPQQVRPSAMTQKVAATPLAPAPAPQQRRVHFAAETSSSSTAAPKPAASIFVPKPLVPVAAPSSAAPPALSGRKRRRIRLDGSESPDEGDDEESGLIDVSEVDRDAGVLDLTKDSGRGGNGGADDEGDFDLEGDAAQRGQRGPARKKAREQSGVGGAAVKVEAAPSASIVVVPPLSALPPTRSTSPASGVGMSDEPVHVVASPPPVVDARASLPLPLTTLLPLPGQEPAAIFTGVMSICSEAREELVVALRRLRLHHSVEGGVHNAAVAAAVALRLRHSSFSHAAWEELVLLLETADARKRRPALYERSPVAQVASVDISMSQVSGDAGWSYILLALPKLPKLQLLDLSFTTVGQWCLPHLHRCIGRAPLLRELRLDGCARLTGFGRTGDDESEALAAALSSNPHLEELSLRGCGLTPPAVAALFRHLRSKVLGLRSLDLSYVRCLCFRLSECTTRTESTDVPDGATGLENGGWPMDASADDAMQLWREALSTQALLCPADAEQFRDVYQALSEWLSRTAPDVSRPTAQSFHGGADVRLALGGWSGGLGLWDTLAASLRSASADGCRLHSLELRDCDLSAAQAQAFVNALQAQAQQAPNPAATAAAVAAATNATFGLQRLHFSSLLPGAAGERVWSVLQRGIPPSVHLLSVSRSFPLM